MTEKSRREKGETKNAKKPSKKELKAKAKEILSMPSHTLSPQEMKIIKESGYLPDPVD